MMIKTKSAFIIFLILCIIIFPYNISILLINSDFLSSIVPGWNTTILPGQIISNLFKFLALTGTVICYWKLSRISDQISLKLFLIHLLITVPAIFIGKIGLYELINFISYTPENFLKLIRIIVFINISVNILFFIGQIIFWRFYFKSKKRFDIQNLT